MGFSFSQESDMTPTSEKSLLASGKGADHDHAHKARAYKGYALTCLV